MGGGEGRIKKLATQKGAEGVPGIVKELKAAPQEKKEECAHLLDVIALQNEANPALIVKAGAIKPLVEMVSHGTDGGQIHAAATLATIASSREDFRTQIVKAGAIVPLVTLTRMGSQRAQIYAAAAVASISEETEYKDPVIKAGAVSPLVRLVRDGVAIDAQVHASTAIANLSAQNPTAQNAIYAAGAVPLLLALLESGKAQVAAAHALEKLMSPGPEKSNFPPDVTPANTEIQKAIAIEGGIPPLLSLLNGMNTQGQVHAAAALSNLARGNEETQNQIVAAGGIGPLLQMLSSRVTQAQAQASSALAHLARFNRANQDLIARFNGIPLSVGLLASSNPLDVQAMAALAMTELTRDNLENQSTATEQGAISSLVMQVRGPGTAKDTEIVKAEAAGALWVLAENHPENKVAIEGAGGIFPTVALLASPSIRAQKHAGNALASFGFDNIHNQTQITGQLVAMLGNGSPEAKSNAAASLWRLVKENPSSKEIVARAGPTSSLISLLKEGTDEAKAYALWSLSLSIDAGNQHTLLDEEGVDPLVQALKSPIAITRQQAAAALARLALDNSKAQDAIAKKGSIEPLIKIIKRTGKNEPDGTDTAELSAIVEAREHAAAALAALAFLPQNRDQIVATGGIAPLVAQLLDEEPMSQKFAAAALARLATGQSDEKDKAKATKEREIALQNARDIAKAGAIPSLVVLLEGQSGEAAQEEAAGALFALADDETNRLLITEAGGIGPLVGLLGSSNSDARRHAEGGLVRLSIESANRAIIIEKLVRMLESKGTSSQEQSAAALSNLASDSEENRRSIVDAGGIKPLLSLLEGSSSKAKENSVSAISQLAYKSLEIQTAISRAGGIPLLANVLTTTSSNPKEMMLASTLCALAATAVSRLAEGNTAIAVEFNENGAIAPLVAMLGSNSPELQANAAGALAQLSHNSADNQAAVARTGAIAPLCTLVREGSADVKEQSAAALWSLSHDNAANKATVAKLGGIEPLVTLLVAGGTQNSFEQSVGALASLSQKHADNREVIAKLIVARLNSRMAMVQTPGGATRVLNSVSRLCFGVNANQIAMAKAGAVPHVIMWLSGGFDVGTSKQNINIEAQQHAAEALLSMAALNEPLQGLIVRSTGIPPMIDLASKSILPTQAAAVRTLWHLAGNSEYGTTIARAGGMQPLCSMLSSEAVQAQELAAIAISRLLRCNASVSTLVANVGGVVPLVKLLRDGSPAGQQQAACAITDVANVPANRDLIADAGGIKALVDLLNSTVMGTPETAARALANLARDGLVTPDDGGAPPDSVDGHDMTAMDHVDKPGAARRRKILEVGGVKRLIGMLTSVSLSGTVTAKRMWELVVKVIGPSAEDVNQAAKEGAPAKRPEFDEVLGVQEQAAATLSDLAYGDENMQDSIIGEKGVPPLLTLLRNGSQISQEYAARTIWHLCAATDNQGLIVDCGAITELVALSRVGSARAQELSAAVISDLAKGAILEREKMMKEAEAAKADGIAKAPSAAEAQPLPDAADVDDGDASDAAGSADGEAAAPSAEEDIFQGDRLSAIAAAGGVIPLVGLVTNGNQMGKERAASALWHLSVDAKNQIAIARAGGIPPVVQLLDDGTEQAHEHAEAALARLAHENPDNQAQIAKKLVGLVGSGREGAQRRAAHVLWELASNNPGAPVRIVNAGAISPLVTLLGTGTIEAKEEAVGALTCLAHNDPSNQLAIATGLVALLGCGSAEAQEQVTQMLIKFATHKDNRGAIAEAGAIQRLVVQLRGGAESSLKAQELAAAVLSVLSGDSMDNVESIAAHGGIKPVVSLLISESPEAQARAASVVAEMSRNSQDIQTTYAKEGAMEHLVNLLIPREQSDSGGSLEGRSEAAGALWSLSKDNNDTTTKIAEIGAIVPLVRLLSEKVARAQINASGALASLAVGSKAIQDQIAAAGGIEPLTGLLSPQHDDEVHAHAAKALSALALNHSSNQTAVAKAGGIKLLVALLKHDEGAEKAKAAAADALWSFASKHSKNQKAIAEADGLSPLVALLGIGNEDTQKKAAGALAAIALDNMSNEGNVAEMLVTLLAADDIETRTKAARAISRLAKAHCSNQVAIANAGGIKPLVSMLSHDTNPDGTNAEGGEEKVSKAVANIRVNLKKEVASALWSMAFKNERNQAAIAEEGGIPCLIALLSHSNSIVHRDAAGALWALGAAPYNQELIASSGGIPPLVNLLTDGNLGAKETAAGALHSLAECEENRVRISDAGGVPALVCLFETNSVEAKAEAAGALSTMVVNNPPNQSTVAHELVDVLVKSTSSSAAQEAVTELLYKLSLDPENRAALSKWGAIPQLAVQLREGTAAAQGNAALGLSQIALKSPQHRVQVTAQLIVLLGSPDASVRQRAWSALKDMAAEAGSDSQMTVQMAGGIDRFVSLLKDGSLEAQEYALWLLWQSNDTASKRAIACAGCAKPIITILSSGKLSKIAEEHAAAVLSGMTSHELAAVEEPARSTNKSDIIEAGGVDPLVKLLRDGSMGAKRHSALALAQLARAAEGANNDAQKGISSKGAIVALVEWLNDPKLGPPGMAARALSDIAKDCANTQETIAKAGALQPLVSMCHHGTPEMQKWAAAALAAMAEKNEENQVKIAEVHGIPPLVVLLKNSHTAPHENATRAIWHLAANRDNQLTIAREGSLPPLVALLSAHEDMTKECAAAALQALSAQDCTENQLALARVGAIQPLVWLLGSDSTETQLFAQGALLNISSPNQDTRAAVVKPLVELLEVRNAAAQMKSAESLAILANRSIENRAVIAAAGAIPPLVGLLGDGRNVNKSQIRAAAALSDLARASENKQEIVKAGGVSPLVTMLSSSSVEAQTRASGALWHLASSTGAQQLIAEANGIPPLVNLLSSERISAANHAACALFHLVVSASVKGAIVDAGGVPLLVDLLGKTDNIDAQDAISALLADLARQRGNVKSTIVNGGGIKHLIQLLQTGSAAAQKNASCGLWALTSEGGSYQKKVIEAGGIPHLITLLTGNQKAQGYAAAALCNLAHDPQARETITENGAVEQLIKISEGPENWLRSQAVGILQLLKIDAPKGQTVAQSIALQFVPPKPYYQTVDHEKEKNKRSRGWDSIHGNPRFESETGEFDHLLVSPRMIKNSYKQEVKKNGSPRHERPSPPPPPLDFDAPNARVAAALAAQDKPGDVKEQETSEKVKEDAKESAHDHPSGETATERDQGTPGTPKGSSRRKGKRSSRGGQQSPKASTKVGHLSLPSPKPAPVATPINLS